MPATESLYKALKIVPFGIFMGIALLIAGICCLCVQQTIETHEKKCNGSTLTKYHYENINSVDYWNCEDVSGDFCFNSSHVTCSCNVLLEVPKFIEGDVVISYKLDTFFDKQKGLLSSRDDSQLSGNLNTTVSPACSPYDIDNGKPIAPCGALADAMFNDTFGAMYHTDLEYPIPSISYGLLHDNEKIGFKNPPGDLRTALKNFTKPKSWLNNIWELDKENRNNNGFENEAFIVWMRYSELPIRPMWRLNRTSDAMFAKGLPPNNYTITMNYQYPYSLYSGPRNLTLYREYKTEEPLCETITISTQQAMDYDLGVAGVVIGVIYLVTSAALVIAFKVKVVNDKSEKTGQPVNDPNPRISKNTPTPASNPVTEAIEINSNTVNERGDSEQKLLIKPPVIAEEIEPEQEPLKEIQEEEYL